MYPGGSYERANLLFMNEFEIEQSDLDDIEIEIE